MACSSVRPNESRRDKPDVFALDRISILEDVTGLSEEKVSELNAINNYTKMDYEESKNTTHQRVFEKPTDVIVWQGERAIQSGDWMWTILHFPSFPDFQ